MLSIKHSHHSPCGHHFFRQERVCSTLCAKSPRSHHNTAQIPTASSANVTATLPGADRSSALQSFFHHPAVSKLQAPEITSLRPTCPRLGTKRTTHLPKSEGTAFALCLINQPFLFRILEYFPNLMCFCIIYLLTIKKFKKDENII